MSDTVIKVENLSKRYRIGERQAYKTFREAIIDAAKAPLLRLRGAMGKSLSAKRSGAEPIPSDLSSKLSSQDKFIWALKDVSFEVKRGEVLGVIGRNGAGKSTLLKILSKITEPTEGRVELRGRIGSLLEVGTGFHPELTGHENIYLYGAILGMDRYEVTRKFDEIVAFAELEKFIDTPVKRYSTGMYLRLAFAVAAHLEPEILLVDEVLAVGDIAFQKKCMGKMGEVSKEGRTVLFVSHNISAIGSLCANALRLDAGALVDRGDAKEVINRYLNSMKTPFVVERKLDNRIKADVSEKELFFLSVWTETLTGEKTSQFKIGQPFIVGFKYAVKKALPNALIAMRIETLEGQIIIDSWDSDWLETKEYKPGIYTVKIKVDPQDLHPNLYQISLVAAVHLVRWIDRVDGAIHIEILPLSEETIWRSERKAILARILEWKITYES